MEPINNSPEPAGVKNDYEDGHRTPDWNSHHEFAEENILDCDCGTGYTSMWLNHLSREEKLKK